MGPMPRKRVKRETVNEVVVANNGGATEETVKTSKGKKSQKRTKKSSATTISSQKTPKFKCSECLLGFDTEKDINSHIFSTHYGLARINDDLKTPFTENQIIQALIKAQKVMKVLKCHNEGCNKTFKSGLGLKMHWDLCGKSESEITKNCEICGKQLKIQSVSYHMRSKHSNRSPDSPSDEEVVTNNEDNSSAKTPRKRASAIKAQKTIKKSTKGELIISGSVSDNELTAKSDSDTEVEAEEPEDKQTFEKNKTSRELKELKDSYNNKLNTESGFRQILLLWRESVISIKEFLREIPKDQFQQWLNTVSLKGKVRCPLEGCNQAFTTRDGLKYHYQRCGIEFKFTYKCKLCGFEALKGNKTIVQHLWTTHKESIPELPSELLEFITEVDMSRIGNQSNGSAKYEINRKDTTTYALEFHRRFYKQKSFPSYVPTSQSWIPLSEDELSAYIPTPNPSAYFKSTLSTGDSWNQLNLFESLSTQQYITFFVGGPVWATAWCPLPHSATTCDQFLAVASNMNWDTTHTLNDTDIESGLIQLWSVGQLGTAFDATVKPRLAFSIAHCCGMVWDMEWCPGGTTWDDISGHKPNDTQALPRMGLLALACGDGFVRIHSIPHPQTLNNSYDNTLYYNEPVVILNPPGVGNSVNCENTICKCISWIKSNEQHLMVAGYGSGVIAVWDLTTKSSLLIVEQSVSQTILRPLNSWMAHSASVNGIKWFDSSSDQFVVSCGFDRSAKLWNLKDLTVPITTVKRGLFTAIDTHMQWNGMFLGNDDCYLGFQNNVIFKDFGFSNFSANSLTTHKSCVWDMSLSEWTAAVVSVDAAGEAVIFPNFQFKADPKRKPYDRLPLFHISVQPLDEITPKPSKNTKTKKSKQKDDKNDLIIDAKEPPLRSYAEFTAKYGLVFNDYDLTSAKAIPIDEINRIRLPTHMQYQRLSDYPLLSINRVCWNPNHTSCVWLLTATQSGLCRLSCVPFLSPTPAPALNT